MANYSFKETLEFFSEKLQTRPPATDVENGTVELVLDGLHVVLSRGSLEGCLKMSIVLGLMLQPVREERLKELTASNFLGINTGGCSLSLDAAGVSLKLTCHTTCGSPPQENWEWLHRIACVAREWDKVLRLWDEFVPLNASIQEKQHESQNQATSIYRG